MPRLGLALVLALPVALAAQAPSNKPALLVLAKSDLTLSIVDPTTLKVLGTVPSGPDPHEVVASPDGRTAYISNYGGGSLNTITVVDLVGRKALEPIALGALRGPHGLMFAAGKVWFTAEGAKVVGSYDPASKAIDLVIGTGQNGTHMVVTSEDGGRVMTSNTGSASISIFERTAGRGRAGTPPPPPGGRGPGAPQGNWNGVVIPAGRGVEGFDVSPDGRELWAANAQDGTITVIDVAGRTGHRHAAGRSQGRQPPQVHARWASGARVDAQRSRSLRVRCGEPQGSQAPCRRHRRGGPSGAAGRCPRVRGVHARQLRRSGRPQESVGDREDRCRQEPGRPCLDIDPIATGLRTGCIH